MNTESNPEIGVAAKGGVMQAQDGQGILLWPHVFNRGNARYRLVLPLYKSIRLGLVIGVGVLLWAWFAWLFYQQILQSPTLGYFDRKLWLSPSAFWFWFGALFISYGVSLIIRLSRSVYQVTEIRFKKKPDVSLAMDKTVLRTIDEAYLFASKRGDESMGPLHLLSVMSKHTMIHNIFVRLSIPPENIKKFIETTLDQGGKGKSTTVGTDTHALLFHAFILAEQSSAAQVRLTELLLVCVRALPQMQEKMYELGSSVEKLQSVVDWTRSRYKLQDQLLLFRKIARTRPTSGIDRAMTAMATPLLNSFSKDVTLSAQFGHTGTIVGRDQEIAQVIQLFEGGAKGVLLVGDAGVGKTAIVEGVAQMMVQEKVPEILKDKRMVRVDVGALLSGVSASHAGERLLAMLNEIRQSGNVVIVLPDVHTLVAAKEGGEGALNVAGVLKEVVEGAGIPVIATTGPALFRRVIKGSALDTLLQPLTVEPMDEVATITVLQTKVGIVEYQQSVFFSYDALEAIADFARKHLQDQLMPESAIELMKEVAVSVKNKKGKQSFITRDDVAQVVSSKTNIPVSAVSAEEGDKLMQLEKLMHERLIGQDQAVEAVANSLRRARAQLTSGKRPIANFLFVGPTGVGKTELAKTIADVYFGGEDKMIRFDMSEYQDQSSIYRLIGQPDTQGSGMLTEAVRSQPFTLLLLDELEKADKQVLNVFLQVMDDGRITDSVGRVVDFTNVILAATSNAGSQFIVDQVNAGASHEDIQEKLLSNQLRDHFTPEFINRFDGVIVFHPLSQDHISQIAGLMVRSLGKTIEEKYGAVLEVTDAALAELASQGYDPQFGARPMRRALAEHLENAVAKVLLGQKVGRGSTIVYDVGGKVSVKAE